MIGYWQLWANHLQKDFCDYVVEKALKIEPTEATIGFDETNRTDTEYRRSKLRWIDRTNLEWADVFHVVESYFNSANSTAFGFDLTYIPYMQFTEYDAGDEGKYDWHEDIQWANTDCYHRKLSMVIQLSDPTDYEGCDLELAPPEYESPDPETLRTRGSIVVFPSFVRHRVTPISKGKRYSLVAWMQGPKFR